jgi:cyclohexyl-isocyanide hydratase
MKTAICLFSHADEMDFVPVLEILDGVRRYHSGKPEPPIVRLCGLRTTLTCAHGMRVLIDEHAPDLIGYDLVVVPGGPGTREIDDDDATAYLKWLKSFPLGEGGRRVASVCTGALWLARAGWLKGRKATSHHRWLPDVVKLGGCEPVHERVVVDGPVWTAAGVTSSIELALALVRERYGETVTKKIMDTLEYPAPVGPVAVAAKTADGVEPSAAPAKRARSARAPRQR